MPLTFPSRGGGLGALPILLTALALVSLVLLPPLPHAGTAPTPSHVATAQASHRTIDGVAEPQVLAQPGHDSVLSSPTYIWTNRTTATHPLPRSSSMLAYDPSLGSAVLFGGWNGSIIYNDTWSYLGGSWTPLTPSKAPPVRMGGNLEWDPVDGYLLLFGGWNWSGPMNDTWMFKGGTWTLLHPAKSPAPRDLAGMAWDNADRYMVLFAGIGTASATLNDTWTFVGGNWTQVRTPSNLPGRNGPGMVYDPIDGYVVMTQGEAATYYNDLWTFKAGFWTQLSGSVPMSVRDGASMVYDPATNYTLYFAGEDLGVYLNQTWTFLGGTFTQLTLSRAPPTAQYMTATFDVADNYVLAFGGAIRSHLSAQTWAWSRPLPLTLSASDSGSSTTVGTTERFSATAWGGVAPLAVAWQFGDNSSAPGGDTQHTYSWPGNYTANCTASDASGTRTTQSFTIMVTWGAGAPIIVTPSASPTSGPATLTVSFSGAATGGFPGYVPTWSYGDGSPPASGWNETHPYTRTGSFTATLSVTDRAGRSGSAT
ncbi:MAG: PKD domain-containing protein, partial [Thermoplasmata archaeon]|nr:PKD domain-containing protein [Thermoplasmata archaeon]